MGDGFVRGFQYDAAIEGRGMLTSHLSALYGADYIIWKEVRHERRNRKGGESSRGSD